MQPVKIDFRFIFAEREFMKTSKRITRILIVFTLIAGITTANENMIKGGDGEDAALLKNWGYSGTIKQNTEEKLNGTGSIEIVSSASSRNWAYAPGFAKIDTHKTYELKGSFKMAKGFRPSTALFGVRFYNKDQKEIFPRAVRPEQNTFTELARDAKKGDKIVYVKPAKWAKWKFHKLLSIVFDAKEDYSDIPNNSFVELTSVEGKNSLYEVELRTPLNKDYPATTKVRQHRYLDYPTIRVVADDKWKTYSLIFQSSADIGTMATKGQFWPTAEYIRICLFSGLKTENDGIQSLLVDDISFKEIEPVKTMTPNNDQSYLDKIPVFDKKLEIVKAGKSDYIIYHDDKAPVTVTEAAKELQRVLKISTGVELPIKNIPSLHMICLGDGKGAKMAGFSGKSMAYENFQITTAGNNLYIVGRDTPDGEFTDYDGVSRGTQHGVYTFLEKYIGVRWIMPTEFGEEIPSHKELTLSQIDYKDGPDFIYRSLETGGAPMMKEWTRRLKASSILATRGQKRRDEINAMVMDIGHSWRFHMPPELIKKHSEWKAVGGSEKKFCTRNKEAVKVFAENVIKWFKENPDRDFTSISPSDGQNFCRCEKCQPFIEKDPHGQESFTINLLTFYNEVARIVAEKLPGKMLGGFVYGKCEYPPQEYFELEPNIFLCWAPLNYYGYSLYKPKLRDEFERVAESWRSLTPNIGYFNYVHWTRSDSGAPLAPSLSTMKLEYPVIKRLEYKGIYQAIHYNWSYGGPNNYLNAKLLWNANTDVDAVYDEWMKLAYGDAAETMKKIYTVIDNAYIDYKVNVEPLHYNKNTYEIYEDKLENIYVPIMWRIEELYKEALIIKVSERQNRRIRFFGKNMVVFHYHMRNGKYLKNPEKSIFYKTDEEYKEFLNHPDPTLPQYPMIKTRRSEPVKPKKEIFPPLEQRTLNIKKLDTNTKVNIDGKLNEDVWEAASKINDFRRTGGTVPANPKTEFKITYDDNNIYVAFICNEPDMKNIQTQKLPKDDPRIYEGNAVEIFFNVTDKPHNFWHLTLTPENCQWDGIVANAGDDLKWESAVTKNTDNWVAEIAININQFDIRTIRGKSLRANIARTRRLNNEWQNSTWNAVRKGYLDPVNFGNWIFE